ncbi:MAG: phosphatase PAP2 family protein [Solirubrobacterales bacterium]|nr:phosphatase PAP2 family protein [Solirubrobacterales bacterium]
MRRRATWALVGAAAGVLLLFLTWLLAFHVGIFQRADQSVLAGFTRLKSHPHVGGVAARIADLCDPRPYVFFCAIPIVLALVRRRLPVALAIGAILLGANATTELVKPLLAHARAASLLGGASPVGPASWPSGHATAAMALALCMVLAVPARLRPLTAVLGGAFAVAVSYSFLTLGWHYPSDVLGGYLVAGIWTMLGVAAVFAFESRGERAGTEDLPARQSVREALGPPAVALAAAVALAGLILLARPHEVVSYARVHEAFIVGAAAIGAIGLTLVTGLMLALRR